MFYETSLEKPEKTDIVDIAENITTFIELLPKAFKLPPADRDSYFQNFRNSLGLLYDLIIGVYPHLLINQGDLEIEIIPDDEEE